MNILPHDLMAFSARERAAIYAMISIRVEEEKKERSKSRARKK
ncbi:hypothetical protein [Paenibacillus taichungensis]